LIKEPITSELLRFTTRRILSQILNDQIYRYLEQEQELKKDLNNQQQQEPFSYISDESYTTTLILEECT
jgi:hypothetical protein